MAVIIRYQNTIRGALSITGNTLGLAGDAAGNGVLNFTTSSPAPPSGGTTTNWQANSAAAFLVLPPGAIVTYAELTWAAQYDSSISNNLDTPITFTTPLGSSAVSPDPVTSQTVTTQVGETFYVRSQNVTNLVLAAGAGEYIVGGVPSIIAGKNNYVGWSMVVAYKSNALPYRNITVWSLLQHIQGLFGNVLVPISGFATPATGNVTGRLVVAAGGGNPELTGDFMQFGPTSISVATLSGPNNDATNFFASQINNNSGNLDTTGTWGTKNTIPPNNAAIGNRNSFDITNVDVSAGLTNNQTSADVIFGTTDDTYDALSLGLQVDVREPVLNPITKVVDKAFADLGYTLNYTISFTNVGDLTAENSIFIDTIPSGVTFVPNSLIINGVPNANSPAPPGINLGNIEPNQSVTITFSGVVNSVPASSTISNVSSIAYYFTPGAGLATIPATESSNVATTTINNANIVSTKQVDKAFADIGDTLYYTVSFSNVGTTTANNIVFIDTIPSGTSLILGSLNQDGTPISGNPAYPGITLPKSILANGVSTVTFSVIVNTIPNPNPIPNSSTSTFSYTVNPTIPITSSSVTRSNTVYTQINNATISSPLKSVDKSFAKIGDALTYTITLSNTGNVSANNIIFIDTIPNGTTFVRNSVFVGGVRQNGQNPSPPNGISIGSIGANSLLTISFVVTVNTIPTPNPIPNTGFVNYSYIIDPTLETTNSNSTNTNTTFTKVNDAVINSTKRVFPANCIVGDTIFYTVVLSNSGNATANDVVFIDTIPNGTSFVPNSLNLNGTTQTGQSPAPPGGFSVGSIPPNSRATITFNVIANTIPTPNPIPNSSNTSYNFVLNPTTGETVAKTSLSNRVSTYVNPDSNPLKIVDKQYATVGDTLTYTIQWQNKLNVSESNVTFIDTIPNNTSFVANSIAVNGVTIPGATIAPPNGINLGTLPSGSLSTITFNILVNTLPTPNPIPNQAIGIYSYISDPTLGVVTTETSLSNIVNTQINYASIPSAVKSVDKNFAKVGDVLTYTISFTNIGNTTTSNVNLIDTIPNGTTFNINSIYLNGVNQPGEVVAPSTGLSIGDLSPNSTTTVVFSVTVNTVPSPNPIPNNANIAYNYLVDPVVSSYNDGGANTNTVNTTINFANLGIIGKSVSKSYATLSDVLLYTITIANTGNVTANNIFLNDTIPTATTFQTGSVYINGVLTSTVPIGNVLSVNMGNIAPNAVASLVFSVIVNSIPNPNTIPNSAVANYTYTVNPSIPNGQGGTNKTNVVNTRVNSSSLSGITKFVDKVYVTCGDTITYTISIPNIGNATATNVILRDTVPNGTVFVPNSIYVNGSLSNSTSPTSISVGTIAPGATALVSFKVIVNC